MLNSCKVRRNTQTREIDQVVIDRPFTDERANVIYNYYRSIGIPIHLGKQVMREELKKRGFNVDLEVAAINEGVNQPRIEPKDYRYSHTAPNADNTPLHDLTMAYGDDIYTDKAYYYFGDGNLSMDKKSASILQSLRGKPKAKVTVYRAVPKGVTEINSGDWVSINRDYAIKHGEGHLDGEYDILSKDLTADQIFTDGNSMHEQGVQFLSTTSGEVYGFVTPEGEMFLDPDIAGVNTLIHEGAHIQYKVLKTAAERGDVKAQAILNKIQEFTNPVVETIFNAKKAQERSSDRVSSVDMQAEQIITKKMPELTELADKNIQLLKDYDRYQRILQKRAERRRVLKTDEKFLEENSYLEKEPIINLGTPSDILLSVGVTRPIEMTFSNLKSHIVGKEAHDITTLDLVNIMRGIHNPALVNKARDGKIQILTNQTNENGVPIVVILNNNYETRGGKKVANITTAYALTNSSKVVPTTSEDVLYVNKKRLANFLSDFNESKNRGFGITLFAYPEYDSSTDSILYTQERVNPEIEFDTANIRKIIENTKNIINKTNVNQVDFQIIGEQGAQRVQEYADSLLKAKELEQEGIPYDQIETQTGWYKYEGQWRTIPSEVLQNFKIQNYDKNTRLQLSEVLGTENVLFDLYPELKEITVVFVEENQPNTPQDLPQGFENSAGVFVEATQSIFIPTMVQGGVETSSRTDEETSRLLAHEVNHVIQLIEEFPVGGDEYSVIFEAGDIIGVDFSNKSFRFIIDSIDSTDTSKLTDNERRILTAAKQSTRSFMGGVRDTTFRNYQHILGEIDSRIVEKALELHQQGQTIVNYSEALQLVEIQDNLDLNNIFLLRNGGVRFSLVEPQLAFEAAELSSPAYNQRENETDEQYKERLREEVFARALGDNAEQYLKDLGFTAQEAKTFLQKVQEFLAEIVDWLRGKKGLQDLSVDEINQLSIRDFLDRSTTSMMIGEFKTPPQTAVQVAATPTLYEVTQQLQKTGLAKNVSLLSIEEIDAKLKELGVSDDVRKQVADYVKGYYSNANVAFSNLKDKNVKNVQGWMKALTDIQKNGGIRNVNQELKWIGLEDYLNEYVKENNPKNGNIPASVVEEYILSNQIEIVDISKGAFEQNIPLEGSTFDTLIKGENISQNGKFKVIKEFGETDKVYYIGEGRSELINAINGVNGINDTIADFIKRPKERQRTADTKYSGYQLKGGDAPLAKDTEILTDKGWVSIENVSVGDNVLTRRDIDGVVEYKPVQAKPEVYSEFLYKYESPSIYLETTAKHTMVVERPRGSGDNYRWETERVTTEDLWKLTNRRIPLTGIWNGEFVENIYGYNSVDIAEFIGWYIAEGHCVHDKVTDNKSTVCIAQKKSVNKEKCERLEKLFDRLGFKWSYCADNHYYISCKTLTRELKDILYGMPKSLEKEIPKELLKMDKVIMNSLLSGLILGDGCTVAPQEGRKKRKIYHTASFKLASDVQTLATLLGYASTITKRDKNYKNTLYTVSFKESKYCWVDNVKKEIIPYNDVAYCVTVENHAIYVRKNGRAVFTGNSTYREVLLTMPSKEGKNPLHVKRDELSRQYREAFDSGNYDLANEIDNQISDVTKQLKAENSINITGEKAQYESPHWDEANVLAHVRLNEKTLPDGRRVLIVNEIQSDWAQDGRKEGFIDKELQRKSNIASTKYKALQEELTKIKEEKKSEKEDSLDVLYKDGKGYTSNTDEYGNVTLGKSVNEFGKQLGDSTGVEAVKEEGGNYRIYVDGQVIQANNSYGSKEIAERIIEERKNRVDLGRSREETVEIESLPSAEQEAFRVIQDYYSKVVPLERQIIAVRGDIIEQSGSIEPMPYENTDQWVGLVTRRVMQMASQEGYDGIAFVTGQQSADMYSLARQVDRVSIMPNNDTRFVHIFLKDNSDDTLTIDNNGVIVDSVSGVYNGKQAEEVLGKDLTRKILETNEETTLEGEGLEFGGEGMKTFYDKIVPKVVQKEARRFDKNAKLETVDFRGDYSKVSNEGLFNEYKYLVSKGEWNLGDWDLQGIEDNRERFLEDLNDVDNFSKDKLSLGVQPYLPLTQPIKDSVSQSIPQFQKAGLGILPNGFVDLDTREVFLNQETANLDTPIHEFSHLFTNMLKQTNPQLYQRGLELIEKEGKEYIDFVKKNQPNLKGEALLEEALTQAVGEAGVRIINKQSKFFQWLQDMWNSLKEMIGLTQYSWNEVKDMNLQQFTEAMAVDLLRGEELRPSPILSTEQLLTTDIHGSQEYVPTNSIITYYSETGEINYKQNPDGSMTQLKTVSATPQQEESITYQQLLSIPNLSKEQALEAYKNLYSTKFYDWNNKTNEC